MIDAKVDERLAQGTAALHFFVEYDGACSEGKLGRKAYKQNVALPTEESSMGYSALQ